MCEEKLGLRDLILPFARRGDLFDFNLLHGRPDPYFESIYHDLSEPNRTFYMNLTIEGLLFAAGRASSQPLLDSIRTRFPTSTLSQFNISLSCGYTRGGHLDALRSKIGEPLFQENSTALSRRLKAAHPGPILKWLLDFFKNASIAPTLIVDLLTTFDPTINNLVRHLSRSASLLPGLIGKVFPLDINGLPQSKLLKAVEDELDLLKTSQSTADHDWLVQPFDFSSQWLSWISSSVEVLLSTSLALGR